MNGNNEPYAVVDAFARSFQLTFPVLLNANSSYQEYGQSPAASPYPLEYIIDQAGNVAYFNTEYDPEEMVEKIDQLLGNAPDITVDPVSVDFGAVGVGLASTRMITIANTGAGELLVYEIFVGSANFAVNLEELAVPPGSSRTLLVTFTPQQMGLVTDNLLLSSNDPTDPDLLIPLAGEGSEATDVAEGTLPSVVRLVAWPNPFNPRVTLEYRLGVRDRVQLLVYDLRGRHLRTLVEGEKSEGRHVVQWDGKDDAGRKLPAGEYLSILRTKHGSSSRKLMLVR